MLFEMLPESPFFGRMIYHTLGI